jgi:hypothetical protein
VRRNRPARQDKGNREIVAVWRQVGATVLRIDPAGDRHQKGCPDYLVGFRGQDYLIELKRPGETLRPEQVAWHRLWKGRNVRTVDNTHDALDAIGFAMPYTSASRAAALDLRQKSDAFESRSRMRSSAKSYRTPEGDPWADPGSTTKIPETTDW